MARIPADAAERIISLRARLGLTQTALARLLGVSNVTVNRWEHGHTTPAAATWARIVAAEETGLAGLALRADVPGPSPNHLPTPPTTFVGRRRELADLARLVRRHRLVTIAGPGGIGKTRLALQIAAVAGEVAPDGSYFVDLAAVATDEAVPAAIAAALRLPADDATPPLTQILRRRGASTTVVVLDNCEHVLEGAGRAAVELLGGWPGLRLIATSRAALGVDAEVRWDAPPLATEAGHGQEPDLTASDAVQLFLARAGERQPFLAPDAGTLVTIADLCRRLDGLPLAIELAAARMALITPADLLDRLDRRLALLSSPDDAGPARHRALDATIAWSHDLLSEPDRIVFRRLGVFPSTFDLADAEHACRGEVLPALDRLVRQSLVAIVPAGADGLPRRYRLLDSIRLFARERLRAGGEERETVQALADHLVVALGVAPSIPDGPAAHATHDRLTLRVELIQAVQIGLLAHEDKPRALTLASVADRAWSRVGRSAEALGYLERAMALPGEVPPGLTVRSLVSASWLRLRVGDPDRADAYARAATAVARTTDDRAGLAGALDAEGRVLLASSRFAEARTVFQDSLAVWRELEGSAPGDHLPGTISTLLDLGHACKWLRDVDAGIAAYEEARRLAARLGDRAREGSILNNVGDLLGLAGRPREAVPYLKAAIAIARERDQRDLVPPRLANLAELHIMLGQPSHAIRVGEEAIATVGDVDDRDDVGDILYVLGAAYHAARDDEAALRRFREALAIYDRVGNASSTAMTVEAMAACLVRAGSVETAARWLGFGAATRGRLGVEPYPVPDPAPAIERCRRRLSPETFRRCWTAGAAASADTIVMEALHVASALAQPVRLRSAGASSGLTARQREVLRLVAEGRTNGEIAEALGISDRTVERHLAMVFAATGTDRRAAAVAYAMSHGWLA